MNRKKTSLTDFLNIGIKVTFEYNQYYNTGYTILKYLIAVVRLVFYSKSTEIEKTEFFNNINCGWFGPLTALGKYSKEFYTDFVDKSFTQNV